MIFERKDKDALFSIKVHGSELWSEQRMMISWRVSLMWLWHGSEWHYSSRRKHRNSLWASSKLQSLSDILIVHEFSKDYQFIRHSSSPIALLQTRRGSPSLLPGWWLIWAVFGSLATLTPRTYQPATRMNTTSWRIRSVKGSTTSTGVMPTSNYANGAVKSALLQFTSEATSNL